MQPTSRVRLRRLRGGEWQESRQFSQPDASLPPLPTLAAAAADTLSRPPVPAGATKHPSLVRIEKIGRGLVSEGAALDHSFPALPWAGGAGGAGGGGVGSAGNGQREGRGGRGGKRGAQSGQKMSFPLGMHRS